jgi:hypothetical protein
MLLDESEYLSPCSRGILAGLLSSSLCALARFYFS